MSKRVVLKSVAAVAAVGFVLMFSSCGDKVKPTEDPKEKPKQHEIVGTWKQEKVEVKELECGDPFTEAILKAMFQQYMGEGADNDSTEIQFSANGKVKFITTGEEEVVADYKINGKKLTIISSEEFAQTYDFSIVGGKTMYWDADYDLPTLEMLSEAISEMFEREVEITKLSTRTTLKKQK